MSGKVVLSEAKDLQAEHGPVTAIKVTREEAEVGAIDKSKKYHFKEGRAYTHPPLKLIDGSVEYICSMLGAVEVSESTGSKTVKDAVDELKADMKAKGTDLTELPLVELSISVRGITIKDAKTKEKLYQHPIHYISFCAEDKRAAPNATAYIARSTETPKRHMCFAFYANSDAQSDNISATIGEAFEVAFQRYQDSKSAHKDFAELKASLQSPSEKKEFTAQLKKLQMEAQQIELESRIRPKPPVERFPNTVAKWDSITHTLEPFAVEPSMDPSLMYLVPRPETKELDSAIAYVEQQLKELDEGFAQMLTVRKLTASRASTAESNLRQKVMSDVENQIRDIQSQSEAMEVPNLPANYEMQEYTQAKNTAVMPKSGTVKQAATHWPPTDSAGK